MRRIISPEEEAKKRKRNQVIVGIFLGFIMILSTIGFALQGKDDSVVGNTSGNEVTYNGFKFVNQNGLWVLGSFVFRYTPQQVEDVGLDLKEATNYQGKPVYLYSEDEDAKTEIIVNMGQIADRVQEACPEGVVCSADIPKKTCNDNFIIIKEANISSITQDNNCVFIQGQKIDLVGLADQFLFKTIGVR